MRRAGGRAAAMEWAAGWSKIAASTARERPGAALAVVASVAAALPVMLVALVFAAVAFAALALPLGIATAAWWVTLRPRARGRDSPSSILTRLREGTLRLSAVPEGSAEPGSARASLASPRASLTPAGLRLGNPPVDLLVVYSGQTEFKMEGCDDAARMVAARIKEKVEAQHTRSRRARYRDTEHHRDALDVGDGVSVALADVASLCEASDEKDDFDLATALADFADAVVFVVESAVCVETPSDALRKFRRRLQRELACVSGDAARFFANTRRGRCAPFCVVAVSRTAGGPEGEKGGSGSAFCGARAGGEAGRAFDKALGGLLGVDELSTGAELPDSGSSRSVTERSTSGRRLCARCDAEIERHGPGVIDRWAREVLYPSLFGRFGNPAPPRVLSLSSTHTALLLRHLGARDRVVGCDPWFEETREGGTSSNADGRVDAPIPRVDAFAPDLDVIRRLDPTLVVCAYASVADALRAAAPAWDLRAGDVSQGELRDSPVTGRDAAADSDSEIVTSHESSFEIVTLECPLGRDTLERSAAQIVELAAHARLDPARARAAAEKLRSGILAIRARAERAFGGDAARVVSDADARLNADGVNRLKPFKSPQPFVFIEADPDLFSADSCTPLGAALAEGLGVGNVADPVADPRRTVGADPDAAARAAAALAKRMGREEDARSSCSSYDDDASHYPRLPAARFWTPREPDWWIVAHPTGGGASGASFADALDAEDRDRHAALREGRVVTLSDALCHAASQWTPELVDVVEAVFQKMLAYREARERERGESDETAAVGTKKKCVSRRHSEETPPAANPRDSNADSADSREDTSRCGGFTADNTDNATRASDDVLDARFRDRNLRALPASALALDLPPLRVTALDLSRNELSELPGLAALAPTLRVLNLERNWFSRVPEEVGALRALVELNLSRNFLRPGDDALALDALSALPGLRVLDLRWNRKVRTAETLRRLTARLASDGDAASRERFLAAGTEVPSNSVDVRVTVSFPAPAGAFVGSSPADRDASRLRAQLEPWSTLALRRRLVEDFGADPATVEDPERVPRAEVVTRLLAAYAREGLVDVSETEDVSFGDPSETPSRLDGSVPFRGDFTYSVARRRTVRARGAPVSDAALDDLRALTRAWLARRVSKGARGNVQERPSVCAEAYMILRSPTDFNAKLGAGSRKARQAADKFAAHASLWRGAERALREADPAFADAFTALAVTYGFQGSPHIDKQNVGPFYALALGDFDDGTGGVAVEADARTVCVVDTKNRLGKVDGRFPHWVAPWDARGGKERFSLIYYRTAGEPEPITSAAFDEHGRGVHVDPEGSEASDESGEERRI